MITQTKTHGTKVIYEKKDGSNDVIYYSYDESGNIIGLKYNNTQYYYIKNLQGDIISRIIAGILQILFLNVNREGKI